MMQYTVQVCYIPISGDIEKRGKTILTVYTSTFLIKNVHHKNLMLRREKKKLAGFPLTC